jgi:mannose-6-phosphate isomerase-like protein (cupin superfamily)
MDADKIGEPSGSKAFTIYRGSEAAPYLGAKRRGGADDNDHPAIRRGLKLMYGSGDSGGATVRVLFSSHELHVSYVWFKSGFPLPLHSHDVDCLYQILAGTMALGTEELAKGDSIFIPSGVPYTLKPGSEGVEFLEIRTAHDYDTRYVAKTDAYWDKIAQTREQRAPIWKDEPAPYGLLDPR